MKNEKSFIIEISKPYSDENYQKKLMKKISDCDFEVVAVCESKIDSEKKLVQFQIENIRNQSNKHYEVIEEKTGLIGLTFKVQEFYNKIKSL